MLDLDTTQLSTRILLWFFTEPPMFKEANDNEMEFTPSLDAPANTRTHVGSEPNQNSPSQGNVEADLIRERDMERNANILIEMECDRLRKLHHDIYEVYAGSEGLPCETISESYLCVLIRKMVALAVEGKS
jgi:hypothetical protein